jgi:SAM-dependent methyltransferase
MTPRAAKQLHLPVSDPITVGQHYDALADWMKTLSWYNDERLYSLVLSLIPATARRVIELGSGPGHLLRFLALSRPWLEVTGVDISGRMVELAQERVRDLPNASVVKGDWVRPFHDLGIPRYDVVIAKNVLHLLPNLTSKLRALQQVVTPEGNLIVVETISPNRKANRFVRDLFGCVDAEGVKRHVFTRQSLLKAIAQGGWDRQLRLQPVKQHIDVGDWLLHKCCDTLARQSAEHVLRSCDLDVREAMEFGPSTSLVPEHMLRLQLIVSGSQRSLLRIPRGDSNSIQQTPSQLELLHGANGSYTSSQEAP